MKLGAAAAASDDWLLAEPQGGDWYLLDLGTAGSARRMEDAAPLLLDADLNSQLRLSAATVIAAVDTQQHAWRVQQVQPECLRVQSRVACRTVLRRHWRSVLGACLADAVLHELRNPLNALTLQRDLLERTLVVGDVAAMHQAISKGQPRLSVMRERLQELNLRQDAAIKLWLADDELIARHEQPLARTLDQALRLVRSWCSQAEVRLNCELPELPSHCMLPDARGVVLVMVGALMLAADVGGVQQVSFDADVVNDHLRLQLPLTAIFSTLADQLALRTPAGLSATLAALLDECSPESGPRLKIDAAQVQLSIPLH